MNHKGNLALAVVAVILAVVILAMFLINLGSRECNNNKDCQQDQYCGSDNECHSYPEKVVVSQPSYLPAAIVLGVSLIIAAIILRRKTED